MHAISEWLTSVVGLAPAWAVYLVVFGVVYSETAVLIAGLVLPSEATLIAAGVASAIGHPNLYVLIVVACVAALLGDLTGYWVGRTSGPRVRHSWAGRKFGDEYWDGARRRARERSYLTVPIGRWIGYIRTLVPITSGMAAVPVRRYALLTFLGGATWVTTVLVLSHLLGARAGATIMGVLVIVLVGGFVLVVLARWLTGRRRDRAADGQLPSAPDS
ncbi:MAG: DedA family protein [Gordonia sp. (in: high G+C Gram-positive bacteria)]|uniref:DedA family protein n=1 Tax=Gordonia sp. (in: high G+C Gram-positive bacteria) TaxID=84139 RepID=UPI0039E3CF8A